MTPYQPLSPVYEVYADDVLLSSVMTKDLAFHVVQDEMELHPSRRYEIIEVTFERHEQHVLFLPEC